jgi:hypothetical protein
MTAGIIVLVAFVGLLLWSRRRRGVHTMPEAQVRVGFDDAEIVCSYPKGEFKKVAWSDITEVRIRTTSEGPWLEDVYWGIHAASPSPEIVYPQGALGEPELLEALQRRLQGFDNEELIRAMGCTTDRSFLVWRAKALLGPTAGEISAGEPPRSGCSA